MSAGRHPAASLTSLALLGAKSAHGLEEAPHVVLEALYSGMTDAAKADLYALIREAINADMSYVELDGCVNRCLLTNEERFPHA